MFLTLLVHHQGLLYCYCIVLLLYEYKAVIKQYFDVTHMWKNWCVFSV